MSTGFCCFSKRCVPLGAKNNPAALQMIAKPDAQQQSIATEAGEERAANRRG